MLENIIQEEIMKEENLVYCKSEILTENEFHYCPGCGHGTVHRIIAEVIQEMGIQGNTIGIAPVGCSVLAYNYFEVDFQGAAHGRAPAVATAVKRLLPDRFVFTYQGDGDLAAIGTAETIHACNRGENITIIFINNAIYGMTGGQMAPTTLEGMKTSTSPYGRNIAETGAPLKITELVAMLPGTNYVTRQAVHTPGAVRRTKKAIRLAFENQKLNNGLSFVEVVSNCNSGWKMSPVKANEWMVEHMFPYFPLGDIKVEGHLVNKTDGQLVK